MFHKKPHIHKVLRVWEEKGYEHWLMSYTDFNCLYHKENVVELNGEVCASLTFGDNPIIVHRQPK